MNGKTYCSVNKAITYSLSKHARVHVNSLIDRGANGGVVGEDTRVIFANPDRRVSICRIDNHKIDSISIVSAGEVMQTTSREVIVILCQHTCYGKGKIIYSSG